LLFGDNRRLARGRLTVRVSRTKNIKIAPPVGGARPENRISYTLFEPFGTLFSEARSEKLCQKNQTKNRIQSKQSASELSVDPWLVLYRLLKPILLTVFRSELG